VRPAWEWVTGRDACRAGEDPDNKGQSGDDIDILEIIHHDWLTVLHSRQNDHAGGRIEAEVGMPLRGGGLDRFGVSPKDGKLPADMVAPRGMTLLEVAEIVGQEPAIQGGNRCSSVNQFDPRIAVTGESWMLPTLSGKTSLIQTAGNGSRAVRTELA